MSGRPLKFASVEELKEKIDAYFASCDEESEPITITGLALALGTTRDVLCDYGEKDEYSNTIKMAKLKVEQAYEKRLIKRGNGGDIFALKNFGWKDKTESDVVMTNNVRIMPSVIQGGIIGIIAAYTSYQLYGWGKYVGAVTGGNLNKEEKECELIDDLLNCETLYTRPRLYGFLGTSLTGLIITFIIGLAFGELLFMVSGIGMGFCYWLGHIVCDYVKDDGKSGWSWGEWIFGAYLGLFICLMGLGL